MKKLIGLVLIIIVLITFFMAFRTVPAGRMGILLEWGATTGKTFGPGAIFIAPVSQRIQLVDIRVIAHPFNNIEAASKELLTVTMAGTLNYRLEPTKITELYNTVGLDFPEKILDSALLDFMKEVAPQYSINEMLAKRDEIRAGAIKRLGTNLGRYGILINDVYIANIGFPADFSKAIEDKQVAEQRVNTERQIVEQRKEQANQAFEAAKGIARANVEQANGEATAILVKATAQAKANQLLAESLTQEVIDFTLAQKLGDKVEVMVIPSGQQLFIAPSELRNPSLRKGK